MFIKYTVITIILSVMLSMYIREYHTETFMNLKLKATNLSDSLLHTIASLLENWQKVPSPTNIDGIESSPKEKLFTASELSKYTGKDGSKKLYLAILGKVYDVGSGNKHYGPRGGYHFFTGRDASRAFVTGDFSESGLIDDVEGLTPKELKSLVNWNEFYRKEYKYKGKLIGRFYDTDGKSTPYQVWFEHMIEAANREETNEHNDKLLFPPCNVEWSQEAGSRVWCSTKSGGIERDWIGVPRQLYVPGSKSYRCSCVNTEDTKNGVINKAQLKEYPDCNPKSTSCNVIDT